MKTTKARILLLLFYLIIPISVPLKANATIPDCIYEPQEPKFDVESCYALKNFIWNRFLNMQPVTLYGAIIGFFSGIYTNIGHGLPALVWGTSRRTVFGYFTSIPYYLLDFYSLFSSLKPSDASDAWYAWQGAKTLWDYYSSRTSWFLATDEDRYVIDDEDHRIGKVANMTLVIPKASKSYLQWLNTELTALKLPSELLSFIYETPKEEIMERLLQAGNGYLKALQYLHFDGDDDDSHVFSEQQDSPDNVSGESSENLDQHNTELFYKQQTDVSTSYISKATSSLVKIFLPDESEQLLLTKSEQQRLLKMHPYWDISPPENHLKQPESSWTDSLGFGSKTPETHKMLLLDYDAGPKEEKWLAALEQLMEHLDGKTLRIFLIRGSNNKLTFKMYYLDRNSQGEVIDSSDIIEIPVAFAAHTRSLSEEIAYPSGGTGPMVTSLSYLQEITQELAKSLCQDDQCKEEIQSQFNQKEKEYVSPYSQRVQTVKGDMVDAYGLPFNLWLFRDYFEGTQEGFEVYGYWIPAKEYNALAPVMCSNFGEGVWQVTDEDFDDDTPQGIKKIQDKNAQRLIELNNAVRLKMKRALKKGGRRH